MPLDEGRRTALILDGVGWPSVSAARSLAAAGWRIVGPWGTTVARAPFCAATVRMPSARRDRRRFVSAARRAIRDHGVDVVVPAEDASLELAYETEGLLGGARVLGGDRASARLSLDKAETLRRAAAAGFPAPAQVRPASVEGAVAAGRDVGLPCVVKPLGSFAGARRRMRKRRPAIVACERELEKTVRGLVAEGFGLPLVQEWVPGRSLAVSAVLRRGRILGWAAREALSRTPLTGGIAVWRRTVGGDEPGVQAALDLLRALSFEGLGDVQYRVGPDGVPRLMEVSARIYSALPLTTAAGADLPRVAAQALDGMEPPATVTARPGVEMRWLGGEALRVLQALGPRPALPPDVGRRDALLQAWPLWRPGMLYDGFRPRLRRPLER